MNDIQNRLALLEQQGLKRKRRIVESPQSVHLLVDAVQYLSFASNDYLGLANHPEVIAAAHQGLAQYGLGAGASALVCGHCRAHEDLEAALAQFVQMPRALYFSTGYMANIGAIQSLVGPGDTVFSDRLNHACLIDGARLSRAELKVYPHLDVVVLERLLAKCNSPRKLVLTDGVFSMDGDIAPLADILVLCERYDALLLIDDAHGFGVLGDSGRGSVSHFGLDSPRIVYMGTLGKAAGVFGAFVAGHADVIELLLQRARTYIFTTASPPMLATALMASLKIIEAESWRQQRIKALAERLQQGLHGLRWQLLPSQTAIQALIVGDNHLAIELMESLRGLGIWVPAIRPPTVPDGTARFRISLSAEHSDADIDRLIGALFSLAETEK
ncbi:MAG: 8-amino-7-oxononanoate synthase [Pseudomonadota bacterium]